MRFFASSDEYHTNKLCPLGKYHNYPFTATIKGRGAILDCVVLRSKIQTLFMRKRLFMNNVCILLRNTTQ